MTTPGTRLSRRAPQRVNRNDLSVPPEWIELVTSLRVARLNMGMPTRELATKLDITISMVSAWETGRSSPHPHELIKWIRALGLEIKVG